VTAPRRTTATILDYGAGNLHSLRKALASDTIEVRVATDAARAVESDLLVLPGVGSFPFAASRLASSRELLRGAIAGGLPTIGICLGMQLLFDASEEGEGAGLGILDGDVARMSSERLPHIGWNTLEEIRDADVLASGLRSVYYANSFVCRPRVPDDVTAWTTHDDARFPAMVRRGRVVGMQFHPEKSADQGVAALRALVTGLVA
jgi:glutamine amidotransferase